MKRLLIGTMVSAAVLILAAPTSALAFNPQPDPPRVAVNVEITNVGPVQLPVALRVGLFLYPPGPTAGPQ